MASIFSSREPNPRPKLELVSNELSRDFERTKNSDTDSGQEMIAFFMIYKCEKSNFSSILIQEHKGTREKNP
jgi:hypothetical protein